MASGVSEVKEAQSVAEGIWKARMPCFQKGRCFYKTWVEPGQSPGGQPGGGFHPSGLAWSGQILHEKMSDSSQSKCLSLWRILSTRRCYKGTGDIKCAEK